MVIRITWNDVDITTRLVLAAREEKKLSIKFRVGESNPVLLRTESLYEVERQKCYRYTNTD